MRRSPRGHIIAHLVRRSSRLLVLAVGCVAAVPAGALAANPPAKTLTIRGGGFGHGIGMSQYGALGFAQHGFGYRAILTHYYEGTTIGTINRRRTVTVLLSDTTQSGVDATPVIRGASRANGVRLNPTSSYTVRTTGSGLELVAAGRPALRFGAPLTVSGRGGQAGTVDLLGSGVYRGSLVLRAAGAGAVQVVNAVPIDAYIRGVVGEEMSPSWSLAALEVQAVAARTYAIATTPASLDYELYADDRSQVYGGVSAESPQTNAAVAATSGQVVEYGGTPVLTPFFASSGGYTESVQNVWLGVTPEPWLHGVPDPFDDSGGNPYYRWHVSMSIRAATADLDGYVDGTLRGITVVRRGVSPRVVSATVVGSGGRTTVTGPELQQLFGTLSTYMSFTTSGGSSSNGGSPASPTQAAPASPTPAAPSGSSSGGTTL